MGYKDPAQQREYQREWVAARRARYTRGHVCVDCGSTDRLELDHRDPSEKVSHRIWSWTATRLEAEIAKCDWRCAACHQARHAEERARHGIGGYQRGCRCDVCRDAKSIANLRYRQRKAA